MAVGQVIAALAPPIISAFASAKGQDRANRTNIRLAREQMRFQERMSNTAWQRGIKDMRMAGVNPILAFDKGGASSPGGQTARVEDAIGPAVASAMHMMRMKGELDVMRSTAENQRQQSFKNMSEGIYTQTMNRIAGFGVKGPKGDVIPYQALYNKSRHELAASQRMLVDYQRHLAKLSEGSAEIAGSKWAGIIRALLGGGGLSPFIPR